MVLGREIVVQRPLADPDFRCDLVHADCSDAVAIEQTVDRFEDALLHNLFADEPFHGDSQFSRYRAGRARSATHARQKTPAILARDISLSETAGNFGKCSSWK